MAQSVRTYVDRSEARSGEVGLAPTAVRGGAKRVGHQAGARSLPAVRRQTDARTHLPSPPVAASREADRYFQLFFLNQRHRSVARTFQPPVGREQVVDSHVASNGPSGNHLVHDPASYGQEYSDDSGHPPSSPAEMRGWGIEPCGIARWSRPIVAVTRKSIWAVRNRPSEFVEGVEHEQSVW